MLLHESHALKVVIVVVCAVYMCIRTLHGSYSCVLTNHRHSRPFSFTFVFALNDNKKKRNVVVQSLGNLCVFTFACTKPHIGTILIVSTCSCIFAHALKNIYLSEALKIWSPIEQDAHKHTIHQLVPYIARFHFCRISHIGRGDNVFY